MNKKVFKCNPVRSLNGFVNRNICCLVKTTMMTLIVSTIR